ncbi:nucleoside recognition domain-containing protein [Paenibacillus protaetiae]|uniref:Nucleoside recognition domain-containing protein n=1 Tax=Paenibacillus protaetiae TaxID=2509456 RepID=A0A4V0YEV8_9BACL|nr:nucleoside recognition domain-containing protein [Paenibacillus protaetiae]QAY65561.1 nucleoside recognition domain-containing protein [Paenibacillus protaetiae]
MMRTILIAMASILLVFAVIVQPDAAFKASLQGLTIWWNIVFPGLLPFLVVLEIISAYGLSRALGVMLQPVTSRLLKLPGDSGLALAAGWMSGFPAGAETAARLVRAGRLTPSQGNRLLALAHMPNPVFMMVVFSAGFLHRPELGLLLAAAVWLSGLLTAALQAAFRRRRLSEPAQEAETTKSADAAQMAKTAAHRPGIKGSLWRRAAAAMEEGRKEDGRSFGQLLGESVSSSVQKLLVIGGLMIFASVVIKLLSLLAGQPDGWLAYVLPLVMESHLGAYAAAVTPLHGAPEAMPLAVAAAALSWSGISGILQAGQAVGGTELRLLPFALSKLLHAAFAFVITLLLWKPALALIRLASGASGASSPAMIGQHHSQLPLLLPQPLAASDMPVIWGYTVTGALLLAGACLVFGLLLLPARWKKRV